MKNLLLITGAGASHDVTNVDRVKVTHEYKPPLTKNLFNCNMEGLESRFIVDCLKENPLAYQVGLMFYAHTRNSSEEESLEQYLLELKNNERPSLRNQYWSVPLYLYELFYAISHRYLPTPYGLPSYYKGLIDIINGSKYDQLLWLNLNYDLFADQAISMSIKNRTSHFKLEDYTRFETEDGKLKIKYTKPHGSVDWFKKISIPGIRWQHIKIGTVSEDFPEKLSEEIYMMYGLPSGNFPDEYYPAITAPIGKDYSFVYQKHIDDMIPDLKNTKDVLCIGFSALDKDILDLIKYVPKIVKLKIVNGNSESGQKAYARMSVHHQDIWERMERAIFEGGFTQFIGGEMREWLSYNVGLL